ncbi:endonuclease/exonuclease/phosphatase family protein, partial [Pseudomonadota bacterium]
IEHFNSGVTDQRIDDVATVISRLSMDVMGLTEVEKGALDRLKIKMAARGDQVDYVYLDAPRSQDLAVLYDEDTTLVELATDIANRHATRLQARTPSDKTAFPRPPLFAKCAVMEGNHNPVEFVLIVVHLKAFGDAQSKARRALASEILAEIIDDIQNTENMPVVLGGDFNEVLDTNVLNALSRSPDLFSLTADDANDGAISYVGRRYRSLIDHIMVSKDVQPGDIMGDDAAIVRLDRSVQGFTDRVSDHVPVVCRMVYRDTPIDIDNSSAVDEHRVDIPQGASQVGLVFNRT